MKNDHDVVERLLNIFEGFRMDPLPIDEYEEVGKNILRNKLYQQVTNNQPISFVMLGLPFKSTNNVHKVLGVEPDMAEQVTMQQFARFNQKMSEVYSPGVVINVASDGFVFNDLLGVHDHTVWDYKWINEEMINDTPNAKVNIIDLTEFYSGNNLTSMRDKVMKQFEVTEADLQEKILFDQDTLMLYRGMIRFMGEELAIRNYRSGNQRHKAAKKLAKNMMIRNETFSALVRQEFSDSIRLSMHKSTNSGKKFSFQLINSKGAHHSAWHSAVVLNTDGSIFGTVHRKDGLADQEMELISIGGKDSYFINTNQNRRYA